MENRKNKGTHFLKAHAGKLYLAVVLALFCGLYSPPSHAQFIGNVAQASTLSTFAVSPTSAQVIIPACGSGVTTNCIKMIGQAAHEVQFVYNSATPCDILLDGSSDGTSFVTLASSYAVLGSALAPTIVANGYYPVLRLKVNPGGQFTCGLLHGVYSGFQSPLPLPTLATQYATSAVKTPVAAAIGTFILPYIVQGFQCYNPNASVAWLELSDSATSPTLGTANYIYEMPIAATSTFSYPAGNGFLGTKIFWAEAVTAHNGSTAVTTALSCNFQMNYGGPFLPLNPFSL